MTLSDTPFNDTCEPEDKAGWWRLDYRGIDANGSEVVGTVWARIGEPLRTKESLAEFLGLGLTTYPQE